MNPILNYPIKKQRVVGWVGFFLAPKDRKGLMVLLLEDFPPNPDSPDFPLNSSRIYSYTVTGFPYYLAHPSVFFPFDKNIFYRHGKPYLGLHCAVPDIYFCKKQIPDFTPPYFL